MGACDVAPVVAVGHVQTFHADAARIVQAVQTHEHAHAATPGKSFDIYRSEGGYALLKSCLDGVRTREEMIKAVDDSGLRGLGGAGFPDGTQMDLRARGEGSAPDGGQRRRGRARHLQGSLLSRPRSAPLHRGHADRRLGGGSGGCLFLPARRISRIAADAARGDREGGSRGTDAAHRGSSAARCRRLHLRRRIRDDRIDRGQARAAAPSPALCRAGRHLRASDAGAEYRDAVLDSRHRHQRRDLVHVAWPQQPQGLPLLLGVGPREQSGREARAGRHHDARTDRGILRRHAGRP